MKNKSFIFAALGSIMIIAFVFIINITTSWGHPWFIYPMFAVLWWPLSMFFASNKNYKGFSITGSLLITVFFVLVNLITSPSYPWFIYPVFAVLWWPLSMIVGGVKKYKLYSIIASMLTIAFFVIVNLISSPNTIWFIYPAFALIWWPISLIICNAKRYKLYSIVSSLYIILFFGLVNFLTSPGYIWFYYPAFVVLWWPLSMFFAKKKYVKLYSLIMSLCMIGFLALTNYLNTPNVIWFQYTIFYFIWWPLVMFLGKRAKTLIFSIVSSIIIIAYYVMEYLVLTPGLHPWYLYIILPVIWWPVSMVFKDRLHTSGFLIGSIIIFTIYYGILNWILSPDYFWLIYLIYPLLWAVMGKYFGTRKKYFAFSICAAIVTIIFFSFINYINSPNHIWAVYPSFAIIWWPLSMYFYRVKKGNSNTVVQ